ncbi:MAG: DUF1028 domain-containing protein [Thermoplasmata archaeon]|nr:DUF1028 domain-containing protein [Thermoplasmata archaeon]MCI4359669.1 DUF1028 domain-containing protein [Thermoplasmata archaeon]
MARLSTFSIVAADPKRGEWGIAVQSRFIAVGAVVPWAEASVGAVATQALANVRYGPEALELLRSGAAPESVVRTLTSADPLREERQFGLVDATGRSASFTGAKCLPWAGHEVGPGFACQGNILYGPEVVRGMARAFVSTPGDLPERLLASLAAGQREGGDRRGMQSASLLVVRAAGGYGRGNDRWIDLRVDDHPSPIEELKRMFKIYDLTLLEREDPATLVPITPEIAGVLQQHLGVLGFYSGRLTSTWDAPTAAAFTKFLNENNFEGKARTDGRIWPSVLDQLQERAGREVTRRTTTAPIQTGALSRGPGAAPSGGSPSPTTNRKGRDRPS